jgi:hypothetical protein
MHTERSREETLTWQQTFATANIERYRWRESSVEALIEM